MEPVEAVGGRVCMSVYWSLCCISVKGISYWDCGPKRLKAIVIKA